MQGNIIGEPFDKFVQDQISTRQEIQGSGFNENLRTNSQLQYLTNKNAWVKLASSVNIESTTTGSLRLSQIELDTNGYLGTQLAEKAILFNTLSSLSPSPTSSYEPRSGISNTPDIWNNNFSYGLGGTEFGLSPSPGIQDVQVQAVNRGSIRKATITIKAFNKFQFELIELLYLRLGFTMMLEWGWDKYVDNDKNIQSVSNTIIEDKWFTTNGISQLEMLKSIEKYRKKYQGNYDGFFGKVSNFTWNFNSDGTYNITLDLITLGDVIESIQVNVANSSLIKENLLSPQNSNNKILSLPGIEKDVYTNLKDTPIVKSATLNNIGFYLYEKIGRTAWKTLPPGSDYFSIKDSIDEESSNNYTTVGGRLIKTAKPSKDIDKDSIQDPYNYFITLKELLTLVKENIIPSIINDGVTPTLQLDIETNENNNIANYFPNQISLDPRVCIINPSLSGYDISGINLPSYLTKLKEYTVKKKNDNIRYGKIMNIYLNFNFVSQLLSSNTIDSKLSLYKFLEKICDGINSSLGGVNKLEPIIKDDYYITIIDQSSDFYSSETSTEENIPEIEVFGYNSTNNASNFAKDIKFQTKISPQLASQISIGATAEGESTKYIDGTSFSKWNEGLQDRFSKKYIDPIPPQTLIEANQEALITKYQNEFERFPISKTIVQGREIESNAISQLFSPVNTFVSKLFGFERGTLDPLNDFRSVDYYGMVVGEMNFYEFFEKAQEADRIRKSKDILTREEIDYTEYAIWLAKSLGGVSNKFQIINRRGEIKNFEISNINTEYLSFNNTWISQGKIAYKNYINVLNNERYKKLNIPSSTIGFIPLEFSLSLEGISGVKIYNKINIKTDFLPHFYPTSLKFLISQVNHKISGNNWETQLNTISIPNSKPYTYKKDVLS